MKKLLGLGVLLATTATLSACNGIPECTDYLDECNMGGAYTEERTAQAEKKVIIPAPEPVVVVEPAPAPVVVAPPPPAPVVDDTPVMMSAEPQFTTISK